MLLFETTIRPQTNGHKSKHTHAHHELLIIESGFGHQVIGSRQEPCKTGDMYVFPAGIMHMSHTEGKEQFTCLVLNLANSDLPEMPTGTANAGILAQIMTACPKGGRLQIRPAIVQQSLALLRRAMQEIAQGKIGAKSLAQALILETLVTLVRGLDTKPERRLAADAAKNHIDLAIRWLEEYWMMPVKISDLVALGPLGRSQFLKHFQERTGTSVGAYVIQKRLNAAQRLLQEKSTNFLDIALACGFGSQSHFNHLFRQHLGQSPRTWLETQRNR